MAVYKRGGVWWYEFIFAGKRIRESAKTSRKTIAVESERQRKLELEKTLAGMPVEKRTNRINSVADVVKSYQKHYGVNHRPTAVAYMNSCTKNVEQPFNTRKKSSRFVMLMPDKRSLDLDNHDVVSIELGHPFEVGNTPGRPTTGLQDQLRSYVAPKCFTLQRRSARGATYMIPASRIGLLLLEKLDPNRDDPYD